jgi:8-oxo-dGTP diphosphatase
MVSVTDTGPRDADRVVPVAITTSRLGVLIGGAGTGRHRGRSRGGKTEARESPEEAAVRETPEEMGLRVWATGVGGSRAHPRTGAPIVYGGGAC